MFKNKANIPHKPEPQIIYQVMNFLCWKTEVVMIGDTDVDIRTGRMLFTLSVVYGDLEGVLNLKASADYIVSTQEQ